MNIDRRTALKAAIGSGAIASIAGSAKADDIPEKLDEDLRRVAEAPVLRVDDLAGPVEIASMELLRNGGAFLVRVRSTGGAEGIGVANADRIIDGYPVFLNRVAPFFRGKDARLLEPLLWELYRHNSNYKFQGLIFWVCVAAAEFATLDMLGKASGKSIGELLGGVKRTDVPVYRASGNRGNSPEEEIAYLKRLVEETGAKAVKFRLGGRMSRDADSRPGRDEAIIPMAREAFGPDFTLYADANSSYGPGRAIEIGDLLEANSYGFFEEPCPFDDFDATREVTRALRIPVAGGEQEYSVHRFRRMILDRVVDVVQPDLHYHGGFIRAMRVARMADAAGMKCTPHMSGSGLGYVDVAHFVSCMPNPASFHEFKGDAQIPVRSDSVSLRCEDGVVRVPTGPGFGVTIDEGFLRDATPVEAI